MKYLKNYWTYIIFSLGFMILSMTFIHTNMEWSWIFGVGNFNLIGATPPFLVNIITALLVNIKILRIISYIVLSMAFFNIIKNIVNSKNQSLFYAGIFLFFLLNQSILNSSYISTYGFVQNFIATLFLFIIINYLINDTLYKLLKPFIIFLGIISTSFNIFYSLLILSIVLYKTILSIKIKDNNKVMYLLLIGVILGIILIFSNSYPIFESNISYKLLYSVVPQIVKLNFILPVIIELFSIYFSTKLFKKNKDLKIFFALSGTFLYLFVMFFSQNVYLNYISLIINLISSFYILYNGNNSYSYKEKIRLYYFVKVVAIILVSFIYVDNSVLFLPALVDILIILELVNITLPTNFFKTPYMVISFLVVICQSIICINTKQLIGDMNAYLKRDLSCDIKSIILPSKYKKTDVRIYLPMSKEEKRLYLKYIGIDNSFDYDIEFTK